MREDEELMMMLRLRMVLVAGRVEDGGREARGGDDADISIRSHVHVQ